MIKGASKVNVLKEQLVFLSYRKHLLRLGDVELGRVLRRDERNRRNRRLLERIDGARAIVALSRGKDGVAVWIDGLHRLLAAVDARDSSREESLRGATSAAIAPGSSDR